MKKLIFILFLLIILGCKQNHKRDNILGIWDLVSITDFETGETEFPEFDYSEFVEFKSDSLYLSNRVFAWRIEGDSIFLDKLGSVYIKELTKNELIVEYDFDFWGNYQLIFKKRR